MKAKITQIKPNGNTVTSFWMNSNQAEKWYQDLRKIYTNDVIILSYR